MKSTSAWFPAGPPAALLLAVDLPNAPAANRGALVDAGGHLAGVLIDDRLAGAAAGPTTPLAGSMRYAVPAPLVARVVDDLIRIGHVDYPFLGISAEPATVAPAGPLRVRDVILDSPAAQAGVRPGDVLVALDGRPFGAKWPASVALLAHAPGDRVRLEIRRAGVTQTLAVVLSVRPA